MNNYERRTMDFFRPDKSSTDPLVGRPVIKPAPDPIPKTKITSAPPALRPSPNAEKERNPYIAGKPSAHALVMVEKPASAHAEPVEKPVEKPESSPISVSPEETVGDWLDNFNPDDFLDSPDEKEDEQISSEKKHFSLSNLRSSKSSADEAPRDYVKNPPFLKSVHVEKRPLSDSIPDKPNFEPVTNPDFHLSKPENEPRHFRKSDPVRVIPDSRKSNNLSFTLIILITVVLGVGAGIGVFFLLSN